MRHVVLFDVDRTILQVDSFQFITKSLLKRSPWRIMLIPIGFLLKITYFKTPRLWVKNAILWAISWRIPHIENIFGELLKKIPLYKEALDKIQDYHNRGYLIYFVSASSYSWLTPLSDALSVVLIASPTIRAHGGIELSHNCWGSQKVVDLKIHLKSSDKILYAFSDHESDQPMMSLAKKAFWINHPYLQPQLRWIQTVSWDQMQQQFSPSLHSNP